MRIQNLRVGHATNSSSSHSIVIMRPGHRPPETNQPGNDFGWDNFILADAEAKMRYLAVDTRKSYPSYDAFASDFAAYVRPVDLREIWKGDYPAYIAHESEGLASRTGRDVLLMPEVVVLGGSDNHDKFTIPHADELPDGAPIVREDGAARVYYWPSTGFKARLSDEPYLKSSVPELVDVKITDYCPYGCYFCYQGSTRQGAHAPLVSVVALAERLAEMGTFEVALGGGEPTMHPDFPAIVRAFHDRGIRVNATTFGVDWLTRPAVVEVMPLLGGLGVSVQTAADVERVKKVRDGLYKAGAHRVQVLPQHVVGTGHVGGIMTELAEHVFQPSILLLGYKNVGRGIGGPAVQIDPVYLYRGIKEARDESYSGFQVSVDTAFVDQYPDVLAQLDVPAYLTSSPEGKFSMYVDLVKGVAGPSSYCAEEQYVQLNLATLRETFARW